MFKSALLTTAFSLALSCVKVWVSSKGLNIHPLVEEWVRHYFFGGGADKTLPPNIAKETKEDVKVSLMQLWRNPSWAIHTTRLVLTTSDMDPWYTTMAGVVGAFNYSLTPEASGLRVSCWDLWDFNIGSNSVLTLSCNKTTQTALSKAAEVLGIKVSTDEDEDFIFITEEELACLNKGREFFTRWEVFISYEELGIADPEEFDWAKGGLPKWWVKENALISAYEKLGFKVMGSRKRKYIQDREGKITSLNWDHVNSLRGLSREDLHSELLRYAKVKDSYCEFEEVDLEEYDLD